MSVKNGSALVRGYPTKTYGVGIRIFPHPMAFWSFYTWHVLLACHVNYGDVIFCRKKL